MPNNGIKNKNQSSNLSKKEEAKYTESDIQDLKSKVEQLSEMLFNLQNDKTMNNTMSTQNKIEKHYVPNHAIKYKDEPQANKNIKLVSLFHGTLNLSDGNRVVMSFDKYGQTKNCLYSKLIDIVDNNYASIEQGYLYIADSSAIYYLGLSEVYNHIQPKEVLINICDYDIQSIHAICQSLTEGQKIELSREIANRMYDGEDFDYNKIAVISKDINIDINEKVKEMREVAQNLKEQRQL